MMSRAKLQVQGLETRMEIQIMLDIGRKTMFEKDKFYPLYFLSSFSLDVDVIHVASLQRQREKWQRSQSSV